jgi:HTH-type transcriptional regulator/antitoxin HigA
MSRTQHASGRRPGGPRGFATESPGPGRLGRLLGPDGVDLDALDPVLFDLAAGRAQQKQRFAEFFQNERDGGRKGIVVGDPRRKAVITNEVARRATEAHLGRFQQALANLEAQHPETRRSKLARLQIDGVRAQATDLQAELDEYDHLRSWAVSTLEADSLEELATLLIKARIARGWSQRRLAEQLGIAEQQIQRYESTGYRSASLARICDVTTALGVTVSERLSLPGPNAA